MELATRPFGPYANFKPADGDENQALPVKPFWKTMPMMGIIARRPSAN